MRTAIMPESPRFGEADITNCDREPIHCPNSIQPHGVLLVVDRSDLAIQQVAGATRFIFGLEPEQLFQLTLPTVLTDDTVQHLRERMLGTSGTIAPTILLGARARAGNLPLDITAHAVGRLAMVEIEPVRRSALTPGDPLTRVKSILAVLQEQAGLKDLCQTAADELWRLTGFSRVLIYRFRHDGSGEVIAEAKHLNLPAYLGLRYPESDIPKQARELYRRNWLRLIPDVNYTPVPLRPLSTPLVGGDLDMSHCHLRSVSPVHLEYLRNMGVTASMSLSIVVKDGLWGLIVFHDQLPHYVPCDLRAACELFSQVFSYQLESRRQAEETGRRLANARVHQQLTERLRPAETLTRCLQEQDAAVLGLARAGGLVLVIEGQRISLGQVPSASLVDDLLAWLEQQPDPIIATAELSQYFPPAAAYGAVASGLLALGSRRGPVLKLLWFRPESAQTVTWGGDPAKALDAETGRLTPRKSFAAWQQSVSLQSEPWDAIDIDMARTVLALVERHHTESKLAQATAELGQQADGLKHYIQELLATRAQLSENGRAESHDSGNDNGSAGNAWAVTVRRHWEDAVLFCDAGIALYDPATNTVILANPAFARTLQRRADQLTGLSLPSLAAPGQREALLAGLGEAARNGRVTLPLLLIQPEGAPLPARLAIEVVRTADGTAVYGVVTLSDDSGPLALEQALAESETRFRTLTELVPEAALLCDDSGRLLDANRPASDALGYARDELLALGMAAFDPEWADHHRHYALRTPAAAPPMWLAGHYRCRDGSLLPVEIAYRQLQAKGRPVILALVRDLREREQAEQALRASEAAARHLAADVGKGAERLKLAQEAANIGIWDWDLVSGAVVWSPEVFRHLGVDPAQQAPSFDLWLSVIHPEDRERIRAAVFQAVRTKGLFEGEYRVLWPDGQVRWLVGRGHILTDDTGTAVRKVGVTLDLTERRSTEEALLRARMEILQASRLSAIGEVAATIAHEVNQPLGSAANYVQTARLLNSDPKTIELLDKAVHQMRRASQTIRTVREFVANRGGDRRPELVAPLISEACFLGLLCDLERRISVTTEVPPDLPPVAVDRVQVEQVLVNLIRNAAEAMTTETRRELILSARLVTEGTRVEIAVTDSGPGIAAVIRPRLFKSFVTTKPEGTGLGLSTARLIIQAHGGDLWAEDRAEGGAVFRLTLPVASAPLAPAD